MSSGEKNPNDILVRSAAPDDALGIAGLYHEIYQGTYPDPMMSSLTHLHDAISLGKVLFIVAEARQGIVGAVVYKVDVRHRLAKVSGAVVRPAFRGHNLTERLMHHGLKILKDGGNPISAIYATTRTVSKAPQKLTQNLGFKKLGIFPNVHKTADYETHCLTCIFEESTLESRYSDFKLHFRLKELYSIVQEELSLPDLLLAEARDILDLDKSQSQPVPPLEIVDAKRFVAHRFNALREEGQLPISFFPFSEPNVLITSPDQTVEVFVSIEEADKHCVIVGMKKPREIHHGALYQEVCTLLRDCNVRYIETIVRADKVMTINETLKARFIPCAYFPAFQLHKSGKRLDFVIFSRTFEQLDFSSIQLEGTNQKYLIQYFNSWKEISLNPSLLNA